MKSFLPLPALSNSRTASAFSASDNGSRLSILSAAAKSVSTGFVALTSAVASAPPAEAASAPRPCRFWGLLVQPLVQQESAVAATSDRFPLGTLDLQLVTLEAAGSSPVDLVKDANITKDHRRETSVVFLFSESS